MGIKMRQELRLSHCCAWSLQNVTAAHPGRCRLPYLAANCSHHPMSLYGDLQSSGRRWAFTALEAFGTDPPDHDFAVHHMAVAVEHLAKAYLCSISGSLLAARLDVDDLLVLAERGDRSDRQLHEVKTIGGAEVARLVTRLLRREPPKADDLKRLREARNGVAHLGQGDDRVEVRDLLAAGIGYINDLLPELDREPGAFWGRYESLAVNLVNEAVKELELRYQLKLERAQEIFRQRVGNLKEPQRSAQIQALSEVPVVTRYFLVSPTTCPACESPAFVRGREFDYGLGVTGFSPRVFGCRVCDLELQGKELSLAGFETEVDQPPDYDPEWEPDEDWNLGGQDYGS